jgi:hypothetical protein
MVIRPGPVDDDEVRIEPALFLRLAEGRFGERLMAVARATRDSPRVAVVAPLGAVLEEDVHAARIVGVPKKQAGCAVTAPVAVPLIAAGPAVSVTTHDAILPG